MNFIVHIFIHNFYITKILSLNPGLAACPVAVIRKNTVIDASPEAVKSGVLPGLTRRNAVQSCPGLQVFEFSQEIYEEPEAQLAALCYNLSPRVEPAGQNEVFIDLSGSRPPSADIFNYLAKKLVPQLGSYVTVSTAPNRLLAKASSLVHTTIMKPSALSIKQSSIPGRTVKFNDKLCLYIIKNETAPAFASHLPVEAMWTLDNTVIKRLKALGIKSFGDINTIPLTMLYRQFGAAAPLIMNYSLGQDESKVPVMASPGNIVYQSPCPGADKIRLEHILKRAAVYINKNLQNQDKCYRELKLSLGFETGEIITKTSAFTRGKSDISSVYLDSLNLLDKTDIKATITELYLSAGRLTPVSSSQLTLFTDPRTIKTPSEQAQERLAKLCASLSAKYSPGVIITGKNLPVSRREQMLMFVDPLRM